MFSHVQCFQGSSQSLQAFKLHSGLSLSSNQARAYPPSAAWSNKCNALCSTRKGETLFQPFSEKSGGLARKSLKSQWPKELPPRTVSPIMASTTPPPPGSEKYTSGYDPNIMKAQMSKTPEAKAAFLLPYLKPGLAVLDCGSGPGGLSLGFARLVSPGGRLDGVDIEETMVQKANENAEAAGFGGVAKFHKANVYELPFEDNSYDIVTGWGLILYLSDPLKAIKEMLRVLKPGGIMAFVSADWGAFLYHPEPPGVVAAFRYFEKLQAKDGGDAHAARKMKGMLRKAGLELLHVGYKYDPDLLTPTVGADFLISRIKNSVEKDGAIEKGWTTQAEVHQMVSALENEFKTDPDVLFVVAFCEVAGRKLATN